MHHGEWLYLRLHDDAPLSVACPGRLRTVRATLSPSLPQDLPHSSMAACRASGAITLLIRPDGYTDYALA